jgi:hypothetical protein
MTTSTSPIRNALRRRRVAVTATAAAVLAVTGLVMPATPAHASTSTVHGCPAGYVCIYPENAGWNGDRPELKYVRYGTYNLSNQFGTHRVLNNQYDGALLHLCTLYNGYARDYFVTYPQDAWKDEYMTPINSIKVVPSGQGCTFV